MPVVEKCLVCGLDLLWIPNDSKFGGDYHHIFTQDSVGGYVYFHRPVPSLENPFLIDEIAPARPVVALAGAQSRASVAPQCPFCGEVGCAERSLFSPHLNAGGKAVL